MKTLLALFILMCLFASCGRDKTSPDSDKKDTVKIGSSQNEQTSKPQNANDENPKDGEIKNLTYEVTKAPEGVKYDGKIVAGAKWDDKNGSNILLITETEMKNQSTDNRMKELFAYHYIINADKVKQLWKTNDFIKDCPVDVTLEYLPKSVSVTDLDKNGIAENTFLYKMSCKGDVSPDDMKLIMHEGETKYAIRGIMKLIVNGETWEKGKMDIDASFDKAPKEFVDYAKTQWDKYQTEKVGN